MALIELKGPKIYDITYKLCRFAEEIDDYVSKGAKIESFCIDNDMTEISVNISNMTHTRYPLQLPCVIFDLKFLPTSPMDDENDVILSIRNKDIPHSTPILEI